MQKVGRIPVKTDLCALILAKIKLSRPREHGINPLNKGNSVRNANVNILGRNGLSDEGEGHKQKIRENRRIRRRR